jgi:hypothetical protein
MDSLKVEIQRFDEPHGVSDILLAGEGRVATYR